MFPFVHGARDVVVDVVRRRADTRDVARRCAKRSGSFPVQVRQLAAASETAYPMTKLNASWTGVIEGVAVTEYFCGTAITG